MIFTRRTTEYLMLMLCAQASPKQVQFPCKQDVINASCVYYKFYAMLVSVQCPLYKQDTMPSPHPSGHGHRVHYLLHHLQHQRRID
jgi:hypothetical protein